MEKSAILQADLLDIVFDGRNKDYGAYELRRTYNHRLRTSITVMLLLASMLCIGQLIAGRFTEKEKPVMQVKDQVLSQVELPEETPVPPPPAPPPPQEQVRTIQYTAPLIVHEEVPEVMPPVEELDKGNIDVVSKDGVEADGTVAPPADDNKRGIIEPPKPVEDPNAIATFVEIDAQYPGGLPAWQRFLTRNLRLPQVVIDNEMNCTVMVQFVVDKEGNVSEVEYLSGPAEMKEEAMRVIKKSGKWTPAVQNGRHVKARKKQPITIKIVQE